MTYTTTNYPAGAEEEESKQQHHPSRREVKHKRRYCKIPNCGRIVKSQGRCQRHGAVTKKCQVEHCSKQAQGNFNRMCKSHFKEFQCSQQQQQALQEQAGMTCASIPCLSQKAPALFPTRASSSSSNNEPEGLSPQKVSTKSPLSVYDSILPRSIGWCRHSSLSSSAASSSSSSSSSPGHNNTTNDLMPLTQHLKDGYESGRSLAWHRHDERDARGLPLTVALEDAELQDWERELLWTEILLLSGSADPQTYTYLARAWGRDDGLHEFLSQFVGVPVASQKGGTTTRHRAGPPPLSAGSLAHHSQPPQHPPPTGAGMDPWSSGAGGPSAGDSLTTDSSFDLAGEFLFDYLEQEPLSSGGEEEEAENYPGGRHDGVEEGEPTLVFCQPCRETAV